MDRQAFTPPPRPRYVVVMGVAGSGKSTFGAALAQRLGWEFAEGDALHPAANVEKMRNGEPLNDDDRRPWLHQVAATITAWRARGISGVLTCSALRRAYRDVIAGGAADTLFVHLHGAPALIAARLAGRSGHFMPAALLESQFATLQPPDPAEHALILNAASPLDILLGQAAAAILGPG